ncbi:unnamed protein product [marine sediment metagenome]|uniref:Uncharacterized protein n=1 Tax=marine sediment metagenome TaxID=412755 RepID=X0UQE4_9ZZZZ
MKRIISDERREELKKANDINEKKIQSKIRELAIESLKVEDEDWPENYK